MIVIYEISMMRPFVYYYNHYRIKESLNGKVLKNFDNSIKKLHKDREGFSSGKCRVCDRGVFG